MSQTSPLDRKFGGKWRSPPPLFWQGGRLCAVRCGARTSWRVRVPHAKPGPMVRLQMRCLLLVVGGRLAAGSATQSFTKKPRYFCDPGDAGPRLHKATTPAECEALCAADMSCGAYSLTNAQVPALQWCFTPATMCATTCTVSGCTNFDTYFKDGWKAPPFNLSETLTSSMVLQQAPAKAAIWGWGVPGTKLVATLGAAAVGAATVDPAGRWSLSLPPQKANAEPANLTVAVVGGAASERVTLSDILVGEVWLCTGAILSHPCPSTALSTAVP